MNKLISLIMLVISSSVISQSEINQIVLNEGTQISAILMQDLNGKKASVGQLIDFELADHIIIKDHVVVKKGSKITGTITVAEKARGLGKKGKLSFSLDYLYLDNGKVVKLRSQIEKNLKGSGAYVAAGAVLVAPLALFIKGKNAKYKVGETFSAYVDQDVNL